MAKLNWDFYLSTYKYKTHSRTICYWSGYIELEWALQDLPDDERERGLSPIEIELKLKLKLKMKLQDLPDDERERGLSPGISVELVDTDAVDQPARTQVMHFPLSLSSCLSL